MDGFLLYLLGVAIREYRKQGISAYDVNILPSAKQILTRAAQEYPCNWCVLYSSFAIISQLLNFALCPKNLNYYYEGPAGWS